MLRAENKSLPPGPRGSFFLGSAIDFAKDPLGFLLQECPQYEGVFWVKSRIRKMCIVHKPEYVKYILQDNNKNYIKSFGYELLKPLLGNGLLTSEGDFWRKQRRLIQPIFHKKSIVHFARLMVEASEERCSLWEAHASSGRPVDITQEMMHLTMDIVAQSIMGARLERELSLVSRNLHIANRDANDRILNPFKIPLMIPTPYNRRVKRALRTIEEVVMGLIDRKRKEGAKGTDLISMLMQVQDEETGEKMSDRQILDEVSTIFIAGHETTANALAWTFYLLARNPEVERKLRREIREVLGDRPPVVEDLVEMPYTRDVIRESMRLRPPAWIMGRRPIKDDVIGGYRIPAGTNILMPTFYIHRDPQYWDRPLCFEPGRFSSERFKQSHKYTYFPFGGGPRLCIGMNFAMMEMQLVLPCLLQRYRFSLRGAREINAEPLITLRPRGPVIMSVKRNDR